MYMAFTYTDFDQDTPKRSFVGVFNSITDVHDIVIGTPYDRKNMCLINTETYEFREYVWVSTYINSFEFKKGWYKYYETNTPSGAYEKI